MRLDSKHRMFLAASWVIVACATMCGQTAGDDGQLLKRAHRIFKPLPKDAATAEFPITPERVELGRKLFFDPRISIDGTVSCSRCHLPALYATDGLPKAKGAFDRVNDRRAPTILNAALQFKAHWRGDRENVEDQATLAVIGAASFGNPDSDSAMAKLKAIPGYTEFFQRAFPGEPDPVTVRNWGKAIGAFERTLITPAPFDEYLAGNVQALSEPERQGLRKSSTPAAAVATTARWSVAERSESLAWSKIIGKRPAARRSIRDALTSRRTQPTLMYSGTGIAQRRNGASLFPRWIGSNFAGGGAHHGEGPTWQDAGR